MSDRSLQEVVRRSRHWATRSTSARGSRNARPAGRAFAYKDLMERLEAEDADALDIDPQHLIYTPLAQLPTASEKARRDAPAIAICEI